MQIYLLVSTFSHIAGRAVRELVCALSVVIISRLASQRHCVEHHIAFYAKADVAGSYTRTTYICVSDSL